MGRDDLYITVPSYFRCPISLDLMKSPVSLCTGVTYDRSSIQRWLDGGNNTCPATMQVLQNKELVPNHTLRRLINIWSDSGVTRPPSPPPDSLTSDQAAELLRQLEVDFRNVEKCCSAVRRRLSSLVSFAAESEENARFMAAEGSRIAQLAVAGIGRVKDSVVLEVIIAFCNVVLKNSLKMESEKQGIEQSRIEFEEIDFNFKDSILLGLKEGRPQLRTAIAEFLDLMAANSSPDLNSSPISDDEEVYSELLRLISTADCNPEAMDASLTFLTRLAHLKRNRAKFVRAGGVKVLAAALADAELSSQMTEKVLKLLEITSGSAEGRKEMCANEICVRAIVKKLLKVSSAATEHAVRVLWSLCYVFGEKSAAAAAAESNGMAKILVLLQSNCSPAVRQMCVDLLRVFRCSKGSCVSWYDTKTTHIMPF